MPRQPSSALFASGTVPLTPTVTTCSVSTTFHPASRRARTSNLYFFLFLLTVLPDCRSEVHANSPMRILTALWTPSGDIQCVTGPSGGSAVSGRLKVKNTRGIFRVCCTSDNDGVLYIV
eukprot:7744507-Pyramimonas_sp.AAC.1